MFLSFFFAPPSPNSSQIIPAPYPLHFMPFLLKDNKKNRKKNLLKEKGEFCWCGSTPELGSALGCG